jgi:hypothetical protein
LAVVTHIRGLEATVLFQQLLDREFITGVAEEPQEFGFMALVVVPLTILWVQEGLAEVVQAQLHRALLLPEHQIQAVVAGLEYLIMLLETPMAVQAVEVA